MNNRRIYELADCSEFRQTLLARPPRSVHTTVLALAMLVGAAILWAAITEADLVVRAKGRIRPMIRGQQPASAASEESRISSLRAGRVVEVHVREGDAVRQGDVLLRLDAEQLENDVAKKRQAIRSTEDELARMDELAGLMAARFEVAKSKAVAELAEAEKAIQQAKDNRSSEIGLAKVSLDLASRELRRVEDLHAKRAATKAEVEQTLAEYQQAKLKFEKMQLPVDDSRLLVLRQALQLVEREHAVDGAESESQRKLKRAQLDTMQLELANLNVQRRQSELRATSDGIVISLRVRVGESVEPGKPVVAVAQQRGFRMDVAVASDDVGELSVGMPVRIKLDAFDYQKFGTAKGQVEFVSPDSGIDSESSNRQTIPTYVVRVAMDDTEVRRGHHAGRIRLGMTGTAEIVTGGESLLWLLVRSLRQSISLG